MDVGPMDRHSLEMISAKIWHTVSILNDNSMNCFFTSKYYHIVQPHLIQISAE